MNVITKFRKRYSEMSLALKAGFWFVICNFLQKGISFITIPIFTRIMSTSDYGSYSVYTSWLGIIQIFLSLNLSYYVFSKGLVKFEEDRDRFVVSLQSLNISITVVFIIIYLFTQKTVNSLLGMSSALMMCMLFQILFDPGVYYWTSRKRFEYQYKGVLIVTLAISALNPFLGILFIKLHTFGNDVLARAFSVALISTIFGLFFYINANKRAKLAFSTKYWKYALCFNIPLIPHFLSQTILNQADRIMIDRICGASDAALYSVAYSVGMAITLFSQAIQQAFLPWLYQKMKKNSYSKIVEITNVFLLLMAAICGIIIGLAPEIVYIVGSSKYAEAVIALPPICGSVYFIFLQNLFSNITYYFEETKMIAVASISVAVLNVVLNAIFINIFGYVAAAYTTLACYIIYALFHYIVMRRACKKNNFNVNKVMGSKTLFTISILFLVFVIGFNIAYNNIIVRYGVIVAILLIVFLNRKKILSHIYEVRGEKNRNNP